MTTTMEMMVRVDDEGHDDGSVVPARTLAELLPFAAKQFADRPAIVGADRTFSFVEADTAAAAVAAVLVDEGVSLGEHVVLTMHKTTDSFIVIHALHRIGAVVVPLDPLMLADSARSLIASVAPRAIVADAPSLQRLDLGADTEGQPIVFGLDQDNDGAISLRGCIDDPGSRNQPRETSIVSEDDPAYVIFTSGSTGTPKGITHTHRSAMSYAELAVETHGITGDDCLAGLPPLHFDMSTLELYSAPLAGAAIVPIGTAELRFPATFTERSEQFGITVWYSVPFQLRQISERGALDQRDMSLLRHVIYAGEPFAATALTALMEQLPGVRFSNAYGPAETNVVTVHELSAPPADSVPIGRPWGDVEVRIIDRGSDISTAADLDTAADVPAGELGELWVLADSVMQGYLNAPDLTAERCVSADRGTWYRTGDLVRSDNGLLWLAGRVDHQVKVRGVRLELEAIEAALCAHPDVAEAVVAPVAGAASVEELTAAVVLAADTSEIDQTVLRRWCLGRLVQQAVPSEFAAWDAFPFTSSGKIDRSSVRAELSRPEEIKTAPAQGSLTNGPIDA